MVGAGTGRTRPLLSFRKPYTLLRFRKPYTLWSFPKSYTMLSFPKPNTLLSFRKPRHADPLLTLKPWSLKTAEHLPYSDLDSYIRSRGGMKD